MHGKRERNPDYINLDSSEFFFPVLAYSVMTEILCMAGTVMRFGWRN